MSNELIVLGTFNGIDIHARRTDALVDATEMGKVGGPGREWWRFRETEAAKRFIAELCESLGENEAFLILTGDGRGNHTFVDRRIALRYAAWINAKFEVWVYDRIEKLLFPQPHVPTGFLDMAALSAMLTQVVGNVAQMTVAVGQMMGRVAELEKNVATGPLHVGIRERMRDQCRGLPEKLRKKVSAIIKRDLARFGIETFTLVENGPNVVHSNHKGLIDDIILRVRREWADRETFPLFDEFYGKAN